MIVRLAVPEGSPSLRQEEAWAAALASALRAAARSNSVSGAAGGGALWTSSDLPVLVGFSTAESALVLGCSASLLGELPLLFTAAEVLEVEVRVVLTATFCTAGVVGASGAAAVVCVVAFGAPFTVSVVSAAAAGASAGSAASVFTTEAGTDEAAVGDSLDSGCVQR